MLPGDGNGRPTQIQMLGSREGMMMIITEGDSGIGWAVAIRRPARWQFSQIVLLTGILSQRWL